MSDFTIYRHEMVRFINNLIQEDKTCNCSILFDISDEDALKINELLYCIVEGCFLGQDLSKDAKALNDKIRDIANCCVNKEKKSK